MGPSPLNVCRIRQWGSAPSEAGAFKDRADIHREAVRAALRAAPPRTSSAAKNCSALGLLFFDFSLDAFDENDILDLLECAISVVPKAPIIRHSHCVPLFALRGPACFIAPRIRDRAFGPAMSQLFSASGLSRPTIQPWREQNPYSIFCPNAGWNFIRKRWAGSGANWFGRSGKNGRMVFSRDGVSRADSATLFKGEAGASAFERVGRRAREGARRQIRPL